MHRTAAILARGDPGFFDFLKKVASVAITASPVGQAFGAIRTFRDRVAPRAAPARIAPAVRPIPQRRSLGPIGTAIGVAAAPIAVSAVAARLSSGAGDIQPAGTHLNKSSYFLRDGTFVAARSRFVRNRTRNNANGRALRRAIGRAKGFDNLVKRNRKALRSLARI